MNQGHLNFSTDVFSFGLIFAYLILQNHPFHSVTPEEHYRMAEQGLGMCMARNKFMASEISALIQECCRFTPGCRPALSEILDSPIFKTVTLRALQYLDIILVKAEEDKWRFFRGIAKVLPTFSLRLLRSKILPQFMQEGISQPRFGSILVPMIFEIGRTLDRAAFHNEIFLPLSSRMIVSEPPEFLLAVLTEFPLLIEKTEDGLYYDHCYPIMAAALTSSVTQLHREALKHISLMVSKMKNETVEKALVPAMIDLFYRSDSRKIACACIMSLTACLPKLSHGWFCEVVSPRISGAWNRLGRPGELADAVVAVIEEVNADVSVMVRELVPLASEVLASDQNSPMTQLKLCEFIQAVVLKFLKRKKKKGKSSIEQGLMFSGLRIPKK
jgi:hypothetical protein